MCMLKLQTRATTRDSNSCKMYMHALARDASGIKRFKRPHAAEHAEPQRTYSRLAGTYNLYARAQAEADFLRAGACVCARDTWSAREAERHDMTSSCRPHKGQRERSSCRVQRCSDASSPDGQARGVEQVKGTGQPRQAARRQAAPVYLALCCSALTAAPLPPPTSLADSQAQCRGARAGTSALAGGLRLAPRPSAARAEPGSRLRGAHPLTEAILELPRQGLHVAHASGALVLPANHLLAPVVRAHPRRRVPAARAHLLLNVERGPTTPPAAGVRLLDLLLQSVLGTHSSAGTWEVVGNKYGERWGRGRAQRNILALTLRLNQAPAGQSTVRQGRPPLCWWRVYAMQAHAKGAA